MCIGAGRVSHGVPGELMVVVGPCVADLFVIVVRWYGDPLVWGEGGEDKDEDGEVAGGSIFVSIASYRDSECQHTLADLFARAAHPDRVFVGLVWQCDDREDAACFRVKLPAERARQVPSCPWPRILDVYM
jgi:hypothetical protein